METLEGKPRLSCKERWRGRVDEMGFQRLQQPAGENWLFGLMSS